MDKKYRVKYIKNNKEFSLRLNKSSILKEKYSLSPEREIKNNP
jgi:hypothetical protein